MNQHQTGVAVQRSGQERQELGHLLTDRPVDRLAYSVKEAAEATGLSRDLLYDEMRAGRLAYLKIGRRRIITWDQLRVFLSRGNI